MQVYYENDARPELLRAKQIAMLGYGSQGHAQAQNLRDSGFSVVVGLSPDRNSAKQAAADGFKVLPVPEAVRGSDFIQILAPDEHHRSLFENEVRPNLKPSAILSVSHGFSIHFKQIVPPASNDAVMIAPKGPGHLVRRVYTEGGGVPSPRTHRRRRDERGGAVHVGALLLSGWKPGVDRLHGDAGCGRRLLRRRVAAGRNEGALR